jgi:4-amino-4-deoxy-L-arabinose transferase-like glycosyltransferase
MVVAIALSADVRRRLLALHWVAGLALAIGVAAPWFIYMYWRFRGAFVAGYMLDENIKLFATDRFPDQPPFYFYFQILATGMLPWTGVLIGRLVDDARRLLSRQRRGERDAGLTSVDVVLWAWVIAVVGLFTLSRFKLDHYVFPAAPALCLLIARAWEDVRAAPDSSANRGQRLGFQLVGPLLLALGIAAGYLLRQLELPAAAMIAPAVVVLGGVVVTLRWTVRPPRSLWIPLTALAAIYAGVLLFVIPALETRKVMPDIARWVAAHTDASTPVVGYRLNRWNTAFRFYVNRHVTMLDDPDDMVRFIDEFRASGNSGPFRGVMLGDGYEELTMRGVPLKVVYQREGMWATSGRVLWRKAPPAAQFLVVTLPDETGRW